MCRRSVPCLVFVSWLCFSGCSSSRKEPPPEPAKERQKESANTTPRRDETLNRFLWNFGGGDFDKFSDFKKSVGAPPETQYLRAFVDLNGDGKDEVIVYYQGVESCG